MCAFGRTLLMIHICCERDDNHMLLYVTQRSGVILFDTLRPGQDGRHFTDDIFTCSFVNENV